MDGLFPELDTPRGLGLSVCEVCGRAVDEVSDWPICETCEFAHEFRLTPLSARYTPTRHHYRGRGDIWVEQDEESERRRISSERPAGLPATTTPVRASEPKLRDDLAQVTESLAFGDKQVLRKPCDCKVRLPTSARICLCGHAPGREIGRMQGLRWVCGVFGGDPVRKRGTWSPTEEDVVENELDVIPAEAVNNIEKDDRCKICGIPRPWTKKGTPCDEACRWLTEQADRLDLRDEEQRYCLVCGKNITGKAGQADCCSERCTKQHGRECEENDRDEAKKSDRRRMKHVQTRLFYESPGRCPDSGVLHEGSGKAPALRPRVTRDGDGFIIEDRPRRIEFETGDGQVVVLQTEGPLFFHTGHASVDEGSDE